VLAALSKVERHRFVPEEYVRAAYADHPLPIGYGQTISQPYIVALMSEALEIKPGDRFRTRVGFLYGAGVTEGKVTFIVRGGNGATLGSFGATRQDAILQIDLDLAPLAGKTNQIILRVEANNTDAAQDQACWVNPRMFGTR